MIWTEMVTVFLVAVGLAMDAFSISVASGGVYRHLHLKHGLRMAAFFGLFQAGMPILGFLAGKSLESVIEGYDHWIAFGLLSIIGGKMLLEAIKIKEVESKPNDPTNLAVVFTLSVATSIDALAVGVTLSLITEHVYSAAAAIGVITFLISWIGWWIGQKIGSFFDNKLEIIAGLVVIGIGVKILLEHLLSSR
jgi:manganese efflux pump family protein